MKSKSTEDARVKQVERRRAGHCSRPFPLFESHLEARCFKCSRTAHLDDHKASGFPTNHGAFKLDCRICLVSTWYDVTKGAMELATLKVVLF